MDKIALFEYVIVEPIEETVSKSGIIMGTDDKRDTVKGKVVSVGEESKGVKEGDIVYYVKVMPHNITEGIGAEKKTYHVLPYKEIKVKDA